MQLEHSAGNKYTLSVHIHIAFPYFVFTSIEIPWESWIGCVWYTVIKKIALMVEENHIDLFPGSKYIWFQANDLLACWVFALELYEWNGGLALMLQTSLNLYIYMLKLDVIFFIGYKQNCVCNKQSLDGSPVWYNPFIVISCLCGVALALCPNECPSWYDFLVHDQPFSNAVLLLIPCPIGTGGDQFTLNLLKKNWSRFNIILYLTTNCKISWSREICI